MSIKQSFCIPCFKTEDVTLEQLFSEAKRIGYEAAETWSTGDELFEMAVLAKQAGLVICSFTGHNGIESGLNLRAEWDRIEAEVNHSVDKAAELGIPGIICFSGVRDSRRSDYEDLKTCIEGFRRLAPYAESKGVTLNVEILNSRVDHPGYVCDHVDWGIALAEGVSSERVKLLFDIYHVQIMEGDVIRHLRRAMPYIGHIHTAGNPGRHDLDDGEMNYRGISLALSELGYTGYMGHEFFSKRTSRIDALAHAFEICNV